MFHERYHPVYTIALPEYTVEQEPDWLPIGRKLDQLIETHLQGRRIAIRAIGLVVTQAVPG